jgi:hypothetical protein
MFAIFILIFCAILYPELTGYALWILVAVLVMMFQGTENYLSGQTPAPAQEMLYGSVNFFV